jgi:hypothetical protein
MNTTNERIKKPNSLLDGSETMWMILPLSGNQGRRPFCNLTNSSPHMTFESL